MPLFQKSVLNKYLGELNKEDVSKAWTTFRTHFHDVHKQTNILAAKEEQYQEGFLSELFGNVLGYTLYPQHQYNLKTEYKNEKDSKKADGAIFKGENVRAVIELKGTDTIDLGKVENQAFSYKNNQQGCDYVVTSNFRKLRFYVKDATDFDEFDLFTLSYPEFERMYLYLHREQLLNDIPLKLMQSSVVKEQEVTKALYKDYSIFKNALFANLCTLNPAEDKLSLFKKTQKLLDRFLFILFAEDRGLLPPNAVVDIIKDFQQLKELDNYVPLYTRFKKYFGYLNTGYKHRDYEIFAYNGGLFAEDALLDNLQVADEVLQQGMQSLSNYDFISEVDVNILGHIFEHSLNEIEEIGAELEGKVVDKSKTKRKKDGVFYTPKYITKYIVDNTVGALCTEKRGELAIIEEYAPIHKKGNKKALDDKLDAYREWLLQLTILDPACGSGAFLNQALDFLITEHRKVDELRANLFGDAMVLTDLDNQILENNIFGVDINEESVEIARLSLWLRTAQKGRKLSSLNSNIKCGNSLIDDVSIAGGKAFKWEKEFNEIYEKGGFYVVIGNPPYGATFHTEEVTFLQKTMHSTFEYQVNSYALFYQRGIELLMDKGIIGFITPATFTYQHYFKKLRIFLQKFTTLEACKYLYEVFDEADIGDSVTMFIRKQNNGFENVRLKIISSIEEIDIFPLYKTNNDFINSDGTYNLDNSSFGINKFIHSDYTLSEAAEITVGIKPYQVGKGSPKQTRETIEGRIFSANNKLDNTYINCVIGKNFHRYILLNEPAMYLSYGKWLAEPRESAPFFEDEKITIRQTSDSLIAYLDNRQRINLNNVYNIGKKDKEIALKYLLVVLNSKFLNFIYQKISQEKGRLFAEVKRVNLAKLPIRKISLYDQQLFVSKADLMLSKNRELQHTKQNFLSLLKARYEGLTIIKKLADWTSLAFKDFLKELEKQKIKVSLPEQNEWLQYFEVEKAKALAIKNIIDSTDAEIDRMVYKLYDLTDEEIKLVESS